MSKHSADDRWIETIEPMSFKFNARDINGDAIRKLARESFTATAPNPHPWTAYRLPYWRRVWNALRGH